MRFIAIDLETANPRMSSICQIGIVTFEDGREVDAEAILVNPDDYFDPYNVAIHGITAEHVSSAPTFSEIHSKLCELTSGQIVACHTLFDRVALAQACSKHSLDHQHEGARKSLFRAVLSQSSTPIRWSNERIGLHESMD